MAGYRGAEIMLAISHGGDGLDDFLNGIFLENKTHHPMVQRSIDQFLFVMHRQDDNARGRTRRLELLRDFEASQAGKLEVSHEHIRFVFLDQQQGVFTSAALASQFKTTIVYNSLAQPAAKKRVVIYDHNFGAVHHGKMKSCNRCFTPVRE